MKSVFLIAFLFISTNAFCAEADTTRDTNIISSPEEQNKFDSYRFVLGFGYNSIFPQMEFPSTFGIIFSYQNGFNVISARGYGGSGSSASWNLMQHMVYFMA